MKAYLKKIAALSMAALLVLSLAACGGNTEPTDAPTDEPSVSDTQNTPSESESTSGTESASESASESESSTESGMPQGKEAVLAYYTNAMNKLKTDKPAVTKTKTTHVDEIDVGNKPINALAKSIAKGAVPAPETTKLAKGSDLTNVVPVVGKGYGCKLTAADVVRADIKENGSTYVITIVIKNETFSDKIADITATAHGRGMTYLTPNEILTQVESIKQINFESFSCTNTNSTITATIDKAIGTVKTLDTMDNGKLDLAVNAMGLPVKAKINIQIGEKYTFA